LINYLYFLLIFMNNFYKIIILVKIYVYSFLLFYTVLFLFFLRRSTYSSKLYILFSIACLLFFGFVFRLFFLFIYFIFIFGLFALLPLFALLLLPALIIILLFLFTIFLFILQFLFLLKLLLFLLPLFLLF
jgi:hypothetical protein